MAAEVIDVSPNVPEDRTTAIVSYLTILGFLVAILINSNKPTQLGAFHLRQTLGLFLLTAVLGIGGFVFFIIPVLGWLAYAALWVLFFVSWVLGLLAAIGGRMTPVPLIGAHFQRWFENAFASR